MNSNDNTPTREELEADRAWLVERMKYWGLERIVLSMPQQAREDTDQQHQTKLDGIIADMKRLRAQEAAVHEKMKHCQHLFNTMLDKKLDGAPTWVIPFARSAAEWYVAEMSAKERGITVDELDTDYTPEAYEQATIDVFAEKIWELGHNLGQLTYDGEYAKAKEQIQQLIDFMAFNGGKLR